MLFLRPGSLSPTLHSKPKQTINYWSPVGLMRDAAAQARIGLITAVRNARVFRACSCWEVGDSLELTEGQGSHGLPQPLPCEQQQDALATPTPISLEHSKLSEASPRERTSRKQLPERVSAHEHACQTQTAGTYKASVLAAGGGGSYPRSPPPWG